MAVKKKSSRQNRIVKKRVSSKSTTITTTQHVIPLGNGWVVKSDKDRSFTVITDSKKEAVEIATNIERSHSSEIIIHGKDGKIADRKSYAKSGERNSKKK
jgi:hypothetical protein